MKPRVLRRGALPALVAAWAAGCDVPFNPREQAKPGGDVQDYPEGAHVGGGRLFAINTGQQTCNPSIAPGPVFPAGMLWLGFAQLTVTVPDSLRAYDTPAVSLHDRLSITDTANVLQWFIMRSAIDGRGELQGPEWSTHPNYISAMVGVKTQPYDGYAIRLSDKKFLKIADQVLRESSTPHLWIPDSAASTDSIASPRFDGNGFVSKAQVRRFFGTSRFKYAYTLLDEGGSIHFVDYSSTSPVSSALPKPKGREHWKCASPLIAPDGNWVAYHCFSNPSQGAGYSSYIQRLSGDAPAILIAQRASDPHWWVDPNSGEYFIIASEVAGAYFIPWDFFEPSVANAGLAGITYKYKLSGSGAEDPSRGGGLKLDEATRPLALVNLPFRGGMSRDGRYLCTAFKFAYLLELN